MAWEYLENNSLDDRFKVASEYLEGKTKDKVIVDLDCLEAHLLKYINHDFKEYLGNDLQDKFPVGIKNTHFYQEKDEEFLNRIKECDILCVFGHGGHEITGEPLESSTLTNSIKSIVTTHKPSVVILEAVWAFEDIISNIISSPYKLVLKKHLMLGDEWVKQRVIYIYEC